MKKEKKMKMKMKGGKKGRHLKVRKEHEHSVERGSTALS